MAKTTLSLSSAFRKYYKFGLATFGSVIAGSAVYLSITPPVYQTSLQLILDEKSISVSELGRDLAQVPGSTPTGSSPLANQAELVKAEPTLNRTIAKLASSSKVKLTVEEIASDLNVSLLPATSIFKLSYKSKDPVLAAAVLNAVAESVVEESVQGVRREAANVRRFLELEVPKAKLRVEEAEAAENNYRRESGIVSLNDQTQNIVTSISRIEEEERVVSTQLAAITTQANSLRRITQTQNINTGYTSVRRGQDEELKKIRAQLVSLDTKISETRLRFTESHPILQDLIAQRDAMSELYNQQLARVSPSSASSSSITGNAATDEISQHFTTQLINNEVEREALENKLKVLQAQRDKLQTRLAQLPIRQQPLTAMTRKREQATASLQLLQTKLEEARIAEVQLVGNIRIMETAKQPTSPIAPKPAVVFILGGVFGSILGVGVVLLLEVVSNTRKDKYGVEITTSQNWGVR